MGQIQITLNERPINVVAGTSLLDLRSRYKPQADLVIRNGFPASQDITLQEGDTVVFIRRGEIPDRGELEGLMAARHTPGVHAVLKRASVGIAGVGGLGSTAAIALARVGVGRLVLADFDVVEPSNLNRQQYFVDQIGQIKVHALRDTLKRVNPFVEVEAHAVVLDETNVPTLFGGVDVLVEAFDGAEAKAMLAESFLMARPHTPLVAASGLAGHLSSNSIVTRRAGRTLVLVGDGNAAAVPGQGLMAPRVGVAANHQANAVLRLLLGESPA